MDVREYKGQILCDKRWPDGKRLKPQYPNRKQAENILTRIEASILDGSWRELRKELKLRNDTRLTLKLFSDHYMDEYAAVQNKRRTWYRKKISLKWLNNALGNLELCEINPQGVHLFVKKRKTQGAANATINRDLATLKHLLNFVVECEVIDWNPVARFKNLKEPRKPIKRFSPRAGRGKICGTNSGLEDQD